MGYRSLCVLSWIYGIGFGGFRYSFKMLALERVKLKQFSKAWGKFYIHMIMSYNCLLIFILGFIRGIEAIPVLISVPLTSFLNDYSLKYGRAGYYICSAASAIAAIIIFFISYSNGQQRSLRSKQENGTISSSFRTATPALGAHHCTSNFMHLGDYCCDYPAPDLINRSCISLNQIEFDHNYGHERFRMPCATHHNVYESLTPRPAQRKRELQQDQYNFGQGSVGARMGKRLQKSLSFIHYPYCCESRTCCCADERNACEWAASMDPRYIFYHYKIKKK